MDLKFLVENVTYFNKWWADNKVVLQRYFLNRLIQKEIYEEDSSEVNQNKDLGQGNLIVVLVKTLLYKELIVVLDCLA